MLGHELANACHVARKSNPIAPKPTSIVIPRRFVSEFCRRSHICEPIIALVFELR